MARIFQIIKRVIQQVGGGGGEIVDPRINIEMPFEHPDPTADDTAVVGDREVHPDPQAAESAVGRAVADETHPDPTAVGEVAAADRETHPDPTAVDRVAAVDRQTHPDPTAVGRLAGRVRETHPAPTAVEVGEARASDLANHPSASDSGWSAASAREVHPDPTSEERLIAASVVETAASPQALEVVEAEAMERTTHPAPALQAMSVTAVREPHPQPTSLERLAAIEALTHPAPQAEQRLKVAATANPATPVEEPRLVIPTVRVHPSPADQGIVEVVVEWLWADTVASNSNWEEPANAVDRNEFAEALLIARSTGLGGSQTVTGTLVLSFPDLNLNDLTITLVQYIFKWAAGNQGVPIGASHDVDFDYSLDEGASWTTVLNTTAQGFGDPSTFNITTPVGGDWSKLAQFRARSTGSCTSGTGLNVARVVTWAYSRVRILAEKTY